ncbi:MAG: nucleotidyltransferase domain-containing protein, partial [Promethearchaeota archaeon]
MKLDSIPSIGEFEKFLKDVSVTDWHNALVDNALEVVKDIPEAEGVILKGSLGKGEGDIFSDIDFVIIHDGEPADSAGISHKFMDELDRIGEMIHFFTSTASLEDKIIYFRPFVKFELNVRTCKQAGEDWRSSIGKILFDRRGRLSEVVAVASEVRFSIDDVMDMIRDRAIQIPTFCYITAGFVVRGEDATALNALDWVSNDMLKLSGWILGQWDEGTRRAEERFPKEVLDFYMRSQA